jgi:hypothetical protein
MRPAQAPVWQAHRQFIRAFRVEGFFNRGEEQERQQAVAFCGGGSLCFCSP